jgi:ribosomal protein L13
MAFKEEGEVNYTIINGKKVPVVKCETEVVLRNKETNYEYNSDKEAEDDIANPETATQKEHITRSLKIKVAAMPPLGAKSSDL